MTNFVSVIDTNTKNVYKWIRLSKDGTKTVKTLSSAQWKPEASWSQAEVQALFEDAPKVIDLTSAPTIEIVPTPETIDTMPGGSDIEPEAVVIAEIVVSEASTELQDDEINIPTFLGVNNG